MTSVQEIYRSTIVPLPSAERLQLAALILGDLTKTAPEEPTVSVLELIASFPRQRGFQSPAEVDEYLKQERDSWDD